MALVKPVRMWRLVRPEKGPGLLLWFDPECESIELRDLEPAEISGVPEVHERGDAPRDVAREEYTQCSLSLF